MSQHSFAIANEAGAAFRGDVNNALQALASQSSGAASPGTTYAYQAWIDTTNNVQKRRNAANSAWIVRDTTDETFVLSRASNTILGISDRGKQIVATAGFTQTLTAAATLADGWWVDYRVEAGGTVTIDPNGAENIDGATTKVVVGPASGRIYCNGSAFFTIGFAIDASKTQTANTIYAGPASGSAAAPTFRAPVGADGASLVLIQRQVASGSSSIDFTTGIDGTYDDYIIEITDVTPSVDGANLLLRVTTDAGTSWKSGASDYEYGFTSLVAGAGATSNASSTAATAAVLANTLGNADANRVFNGRITVPLPSGSTRTKQMYFEAAYLGQGSHTTWIKGAFAYIAAATALNGFRFLCSSGNLATGNFALYALRKS